VPVQNPVPTYLPPASAPLQGMADSGDSTTTTTKEGPYGMWVILAGLAAMTIVTVAALVRYDAATDIVTALGPVTGVIGTLVGAYFGLRGSSLAQQHANSAELERAKMATPTLTQAAMSNGQGDPVHK
jgi:hypothetical protein